MKVVPDNVQRMIDDARRDPQAFWDRARGAALVSHLGSRVR